ncbi:MAG: RNA polymerase sigma factor [Bacteroidales bacterium]|jgi:RNA polymerase sigma-70 factor (ECF subfamily)
MTREEEILLINRIISGENHLYKDLVERHSTNIYNLVLGVVSDREDAEEVSQDVFVKAFFSLKSFRGECSFSTWVYRIAYNMAISRTRRKKRNFVPFDCNNSQIFSDDDSFSEKSNDREIMYSILQKALFQLEAKDRFLILSFYMNEKTIKELMVITGMSESNVKIKLHRIKKKLSLIINENREVVYG